MKYVFSVSAFLLTLIALVPMSTSAMAGCSVPDIIIGGQAWAGCNSTQKSLPTLTGWYATPTKSACPKGYKIPTRGDWETAIYYSRQNQTSVASLLALPQNGGGYVQKIRNQTTFLARSGTLGAYWSSTRDDIWGDRPILMHLSGTYASRYRLDGTDGAYADAGYSWNSTNTGLELVASEVTEIANIRCIRW